MTPSTRTSHKQETLMVWSVWACGSQSKSCSWYAETQHERAP